MLNIPIRAFAGLMLAGIAGVAGAAEDAVIKSMTYATSAVPGFGVINVYSSDGQEWDTISGPPVKFTADIDVDTQWPGYIVFSGVFNGYCVDAGCAQNPLIQIEYGDSWERDLHLNRTYEIAMDEIPISGDGIATIPLGDEILAVCNNHLSVAGATTLYTFNRNLWTSFSVNTRKATVIPKPQQTDEPDAPSDFNGGDETRQDDFVIEVRCNPYQENLDVPDHEDFAVLDVEMFLSTFSNEVTHPDPDTECKKGRILIRATTSEAGPVFLRLWSWVEPGGVMQDEYIPTWSAHVGSGVYQAEFVKWVSVYETSLLHAMVEVENTGFVGLQDGWDDLTLECITDTPDFTPGGSPDGRPGRFGDGGDLVSR